MEGFRAKQSAGNTFEDPGRVAPPDERNRYVQNASRKAPQTIVGSALDPSEKEVSAEDAL